MQSSTLLFFSPTRWQQINSFSPHHHQSCWNQSPAIISEIYRGFFYFFWQQMKYNNFLEHSTKQTVMLFQFVFVDDLTIMLPVPRGRGPARNLNRSALCGWSWGGAVTNLVLEKQTLGSAKPSLYLARIHTAVTSVEGGLCLRRWRRAHRVKALCKSS